MSEAEVNANHNRFASKKIDQKLSKPYYSTNCYIWGNSCFKLL